MTMAFTQNLKIKNFSYIFLPILLLVNFNLYTAAKIESAESESSKSEFDKIANKIRAWELGVKLIVFVKIGNVTQVKKLISQGANVNANDGSYSALQYAQAIKHEEIIKLLVEAGAVVMYSKIDSPYEIYLDRAITSGNKNLVEVLLKLLKRNGASLICKLIEPDTLLRVAACTGQTEIARLLINELQNFTGEAFNGFLGSVIDHKVDITRVEIKEMLRLLSKTVNIMQLTDRLTYSLLEKNRHDIALLLIELGADVNTKAGLYSQTPLMRAIAEGNRKATEFLLKVGTDIKECYQYLLQEQNIYIDQELIFEQEIIDMVLNEPNRRNTVLKKWSLEKGRKISEANPNILLLPLFYIITEYSESYEDLPISFKLEN